MKTAAQAVVAEKELLLLLLLLLQQEGEGEEWAKKGVKLGQQTKLLLKLKLTAAAQRWQRRRGRNWSSAHRSQTFPKEDLRQLLQLPSLSGSEVEVKEGVEVKEAQ
jgi:hypothetical protein